MYSLVLWSVLPVPRSLGSVLNRNTANNHLDFQLTVRTNQKRTLHIAGLRPQAEKIHTEDKLILYPTETCEQHKKNLRLTAKFNFPRAIKHFKLCRKQCSTWCYWWRKICPHVQFLRLFCMCMILEYGISWGSFYYLKQDHHWFDEISKPELIYKQTNNSHITLHTQFPVFWQEHTPKVALQKVSSVPAMSQPQAEHAGYP